MGGLGRKKPAGRPKLPMSERLEISSLHAEWDSQEDIRGRLREGKDLLVEGRGEDISAVVSNLSVLQPFITRMGLTETRPLPCVDDLRDQVELVYASNKRGNTPEDVPGVVAISWRIRKLLGFIKMKVRRGEVSLAPSLHTMIMHAMMNNFSEHLFTKVVYLARNITQYKHIIHKSFSVLLAWNMYASCLLFLS